MDNNANDSSNTPDNLGTSIVRGLCDTIETVVTKENRVKLILTLKS
jgi:hypothetical protein